MPGHNMPTDPAQTLPSLPPQGLLSFTYPAMEEPPVNNNDTEQFGPSITHVGYGNVPNGSSIPPLMVSAISMTNQVENEITLPAEEISNPFSNSTTCEAWPQFVMPGQNTSTISEAWPQSVGHNMPTDLRPCPVFLLMVYSVSLTRLWRNQQLTTTIQTSLGLGLPILQIHQSAETFH
ncbi:hypothetical protein AAG906_031213 [Vitis piasezkii]